MHAKLNIWLNSSNLMSCCHFTITFCEIFIRSEPILHWQFCSTNYLHKDLLQYKIIDECMTRVVVVLQNQLFLIAVA